MIDILYIIQVNLLLAVLGLGVYLATNAQSYHNTNRALIMGAVFFAFTAPFFNLMPSTDQIFGGVLSPSEINASAQHTVSGAESSLFDYLIWAYLTGVAISLLLFARNLMEVLKLTGLSSLFKSKVLASESVKTASSFFRTVWLQPSLNTADRKIIEQHERVHTRELHSLDILIIQLTRALCWFNPVIYLLENHMKATHEFRADEVVAGKTDSSQYSYLLISQAVGVDSNVLMHPFSQKKLLKQRINMLNKKPKQIMKYLVLIPSLVAALFIVSCTKENPANSAAVKHVDGKSKANMPNEVTPDVKPVFAKGEQSLVEFLSSEIKYPEGCKAEEIEGTVVVNFVVDKEGKTEDFKILKSPDDRLSMAALDVMAKMPEWTPAQLDGKPVSMELRLPIKYALK